MLERIMDHENEILEANDMSNIIDYDSNDKIEPNMLEEIIERVKDNCVNKSMFLEVFDDELVDYLKDYEWQRIDDRNAEIILGIEEWIQENLDEDFSLEESVEEDLIMQFILDNIELEFDIETLKRNTIINELSIIITPNEYVEDDYNRISKFSNELLPDTDIKTLKENEKGILEDLNNKNEPNVINWLIQSQGYNFSDLYDKEKVNNSKFLKSLKSELKDYKDDIKGHLTISMTNVELEDFLCCKLSDQNILINSNKDFHLGIFDSINGDGCGMSIKLEKDLIIPKEWKHTVYSLDGISLEGPSCFSVNKVFNFENDRLRNYGIFTNTNEKPIELKKVDFKDLIETIKKNNSLTSKKTEEKQITR